MPIPPPPLLGLLRFLVFMWLGKKYFKMRLISVNQIGRVTAQLYERTCRGWNCSSRISPLWVFSAAQTLSIHLTILSLSPREMTLSAWETEFALLYKITHPGCCRRYSHAFKTRVSFSLKVYNSGASVQLFAQPRSPALCCVPWGWEPSSAAPLGWHHVPCAASKRGHCSSASERPVVLASQSLY